MDDDEENVDGVLVSSSDGEHECQDNASSDWITESYSMDLDRPLHSNFYPSPGTKSRMRMLRLPPFLGVRPGVGGLVLPPDPMSAVVDPSPGIALSPNERVDFVDRKNDFTLHSENEPILCDRRVIDLDSTSEDLEECFDGLSRDVSRNGALSLSANDTFRMEQPDSCLLQTNDTFCNDSANGRVVSPMLHDGGPDAGLQPGEENVADAAKTGRPSAEFNFYKDFYRREQNRRRQEKRRRCAKASSIELASDGRKRLLLDLLTYRGRGSKGSRIAQYRLPNLKTMVAIGLSRSAAGARLPICGILSSLGVYVGESSLDLYRWRSYRWLRIKNAEAYQNALLSCRGICINHDETTMKLCVGHDRMKALSVMVRCLSIINGGERRLNFLPNLANLPSKKALSIFAGLGAPSLDLPRLCRNPGQWRYIIICGDGAAPNIACNRYLARELRSFPTLIPIFQPCFSHISSGSVRYGHPDISYGDLSTLAHLLDAKEFSALHGVVFGLFDGADRVEPLSNVEESISLWKPMVDKILAPRGPFTRKDRTGRHESLLRSCAECFPKGPPNPKEKWKISASDDVTFAKVWKLLLGLFDKNCCIPLVSRWHSVEQFSWFCFGLICFQLLKPFCGDCYLSFMPGDGIGSKIYDEEEQGKVCSARKKKIATYIASKEFYESVLVLCVCSIPRWSLARCIESDRNPNASEEESIGISRALERCAYWCANIVRGGNAFVELVVAFTANPLEIRTQVIRGLSRSLMYLSFKNRPYTSLYWDILRGKVPSNRVSDILGGLHCCSEDAEVKIGEYLLSLDLESRSSSVADLELSMEEASLALAYKSMSSNVVAERRLRDCTNLALKHPFRRSTLRTLCREHGIKFFNEEQNHFYDSFVRDIFKSRSLMRKEVRAANSIYNGFYFWKATEARFMGIKEASSTWNAFSDSVKMEWSAKAVAWNAQMRAKKKNLEERVMSYGKTGPLGSVDQSCPIDVLELFGYLQAPGSVLPDLFTEEDIDRFQRKFDMPVTEHVPSQGCLDKISSTLVPNDSCHRCKAARIKWLSILEPLRCSAVKNFQSMKGSKHGLTTCIVWENSVLFYEVSLLMQSPEKILGVPIKVAGLLRNIPCAFGEFPAPATAIVRFPDVFSSKSWDLIDYCMEYDRGCPLHFCFIPKRGTRNTSDGWEVIFGPDCVIESRNTVDLKAFRSEEKKLARRRSKLIRPDDDASEESRKSTRDEEVHAALARTKAMFSSLVDESEGVFAAHRPTGVDFVSSAPNNRDILEEDAISDAGTVILGDTEDCDEAFFQKLTNTQHDAIEIEEDVTRSINRSRYYCSVSSLRGMATVFFQR